MMSEAETEVPSFPDHFLRIQGREPEVKSTPTAEDHAESVRSWLTALVGAEHLSLLVGSGLGLSVCEVAGVDGMDMDTVSFSNELGQQLTNDHASRIANDIGRGSPNLEDQLRSALQLHAGLEVSEPEGELLKAWRADLSRVFTEFANEGLRSERELRAALADETNLDATRSAHLLVGFLMAFAHRAPTRERLHVFTTNYDRLIEHGADLGGLRILDRFVGAVEPVFRASRLDVDLHYNPPGIRGEPRYIEGVMRLSKLHGSLDWCSENGQIRRVPLAFGAEALPTQEDAVDRIMIYPNASKDTETLFYPYAELFRDLSAALCRPNSVLVTYGYGFGDDHINRVIRDMLTLPSTHLVVIAYGDSGNRIKSFLQSVSNSQYSVLFGSHFGALPELVDHYLPQPGTDALLMRQAVREHRISADTERKAE